MAKREFPGWKKETLIGTAPRGNNSEIRVSKVVSQDGAKYILLQTYVDRGGTGNPLPVKGYTIPEDVADEVAQMILNGY